MVRVENIRVKSWGTLSFWIETLNYTQTVLICIDDPKSTKLGVVALVTLALLTGLSLSTHTGYTENTITIEGQPVELSEETQDTSVLSQSEMTAEEYQFANSLMSNELVIDEYPNGTPFGVQPQAEYTIGGLGDTNTLTRGQALQFAGHEYVQIDGHHYQISVTSEQIKPLGYLLVTEVMMSLVSIIIVGMLGIKGIGWYEENIRD
jgi:hypothetical protein